MPLPPVMKTALWAAALRADESKRTDAIVHDPYAIHLIGDEGLKAGLELEKEKPARPYLLNRTRLIDELLLWVLKSRPIKHVVYPGSGLDTRPYRLDLPSDLDWYELDFSRVLDWKAEHLKDQIPHCKLMRIPSDLLQPHALVKAVGEQCAENCLFLIENLLHYLEGIQTQNFLNDIASFGSGTMVITDIGNSELPNSAMGKAMFAHLEKSAQYRTTIDDLSALLNHTGFRLLKSIPLAGVKGDPSTWVDFKPGIFQSKKKMDLLRIVVLEKI